MPPDELINLITYLYEGKHAVELLNYYKGVPLISKARFIELGNKRAFLQVEAPYSVCLEMNEQTLILGEKLFEPIEARVVAFDIIKGVVELADFSYRSSKFGSRRAVRVEPEKPFALELIIGEVTVTGKLVDVSYGGVGVLIEVEPSLKIQAGEHVQIKLDIPEGRVQADGKVLKYIRSPQGDRLAVEFSEMSSGQSILMRFITRRREEIRSEVHNIYRKTYQSRVERS